MSVYAPPFHPSSSYSKLTLSSPCCTTHFATLPQPMHHNTPTATPPLSLLQCCPNNNNAYGHEDAANNELGFIPVHQDMFFFCFIHFSLVLQSPSSTAAPWFSNQPA